MGETSAAKSKIGFFKGLRGEFKKITWPNSRTLFKNSITVIFVTAIIGAIVALIDFLYSSGIFYLVGK